jgi:Mce-associated membrane protein
VSPVSGPNLYDVLDVAPTATTEEIDAAWRAATADLTPADRRFRAYSQAAEVLLDPERRAAYDAELAAAHEPAEGSAPAAEERNPAPTGSRWAGVAGLGAALRERAGGLRRERAAAAGPAADADATTRSAHAPGTAARWALPALVVALLLSLGLSGYLLTQPSEAEVEDAATEARSAAEQAIVPVLSYDHRTLDEDQRAAHEYLTDDYIPEYDRFFDGVVRRNAKRTEAVVEVDEQSVMSAIVRAAEDRAEVLLFVDRPTTNKATEQPVVYKDQVRVRLEKVGEDWLVDCLITSAEGSCRS